MTIVTAADQMRRFGACAEAVDGHVVLQVGREMVILEPAQARAFAYYLARAYCDAAPSRERGCEVPR